MEHKRHSANPTIALLIALIVLVMIIFTMYRELPKLVIEFQTPFPVILLQPKMWYELAEVIFHTAGLIMVYGLISLLFPRLRFILQAGAGMANLAGISYLFSFIMSLRSSQQATNIQLAIIMFLLCMILPFLVGKLIGAMTKV